MRSTIPRAPKCFISVSNYSFFFKYIYIPIVISVGRIWIRGLLFPTRRNGLEWGLGNPMHSFPWGTMERKKLALTSGFFFNPSSNLHLSSCLFPPCLHKSSHKLLWVWLSHGYCWLLTDSSHLCSAILLWWWAEHVTMWGFTSTSV